MAWNPADVLLELDRTPNVFRESLNREPLRIVDGSIGLPELPGLGLEIDEELIHRYAI